MLVDQRLDAQLHTMFMVDYQPGAAAQPARPSLRGVVLHPRGRGRRRRRRRPLHASAGRRLLDRRRLHARLLRDAGKAGRVARDVGAGPATAPLVPASAGLELPPSASPPTARSPRREPSRLTDDRGLDDIGLYTGTYRRMLLIRGFEDLVQSLFLQARSTGRRTSTRTGSRRDGRRERPRGARSPRGDLSRPRARARAGGRRSGAARRDARPRVRCQRRARRLDERELTRRPAHRLVRDRGGSIAAATGAALALQRTTGGVAVASFGDGAMNQGYVFECLNFSQGLQAAGRPRLREQRLRRSTVPLGDGRRDPQRVEVMEVPAETIDGMSVWTVARPRSGRRGACPSRRRACLHRGDHLPVRRPLRSDPGAYRPEGELDAGGSAIRSSSCAPSSRRKASTRTSSTRSTGDDGAAGADAGERSRSSVPDRADRSRVQGLTRAARDADDAEAVRLDGRCRDPSAG